MKLKAWRRTKLCATYEGAHTDQMGPQKCRQKELNKLIIHVYVDFLDTLYIESGKLSGNGVHGEIHKIIFISQPIQTQNEEAVGDIWSLFQCCQKPKNSPTILRGISGIFRIFE